MSDASSGCEAIRFQLYDRQNYGVKGPVVPIHPVTTFQQITGPGPLPLELELLVHHADASAPDQHASVATMSAAATTIQCSGCEQPIAFQPPVPGEPVGMWLCKTCGAVYYGDNAEEAAANAFGVVRAVGSNSNPYLSSVTATVDARLGAVPPAYVQRLVHSLVHKIYDGLDRRAHKRYRMAVPVVAVPLGFDFKVAGEPLRMTTKDISLSGASLIHTRFTERPYFALDFTAAGVEHVQVTLEVLSVRNFGPIYEVAGQFIDRVSQKSAASP
jgi:hypothetical protein